MTMVTRPTAPAPQDDLKTVVESRSREWHFHIYFLLQSPVETAAALALRDAVLRLRRDGMSSIQDPSYGIAKVLLADS
jgi:DOPA 4,5-dioxygenase